MFNSSDMAPMTAESHIMLQMSIAEHSSEAATNSTATASPHRGTQQTLG